MRRTVALALAAIIAYGALVLGASTAGATPSFARKYDVSCHTCHDTVYPELNAWGRQFQENGYQLPAGAESAYRDRDTKSPGTIAERIGLWRDLPLSARAVGYVEIPTNPTASSRNSVNFRVLDNMYLIGGGSLFRNISVFFSASVAPSPALHHATIGVHNLVGEGTLNLRAGALLLFDFLHPEHRTITRMGNVGATLRVGLNPTALDTTHLGIEAYGRLFRRHLFYQLAVVQGAQGADGVSDLDSNKDVFGQIQLSHRDDQFRLGALGYYGRTQVTDKTRLVQVRFTDPFFVVGGDVEAHLGPVMLFGYALYGRHDNPRGTGALASYVGVRGEARVAILRDLLALGRYDGIFSSDDTTLKRQSLTAALTYLLLTNLKMTAEFDADLNNFGMSTVYAVLDVAM